MSRSPERKVSSDSSESKHVMLLGPSELLGGGLCAVGLTLLKASALTPPLSTS